MKTKNLFKRFDIPRFRNFAIIAGILGFVIILELTTGLDEAVIKWFYHRKDTILSNVGVNFMIASVLLRIFIVRHIGDQKKLIKKARKATEVFSILQSN